MAEFEVNGARYQARKLNAFEQLHVARKFTRALMTIAAQPDKVLAAQGFPKLFAALAGDIPKEDIEDAVNTCLGAVQRQQTGCWANVLGNGQLMFADLQDLDILLQLVWHVLAECRLVDFFGERPSGSAAP